MEAESSSQVVAKKLWNMIRVTFFMLRRGMSKGKAILDLNSLFKRSNKLAGKAINDLMFHQINALTCKSADDVVRFSIVSSKEYEFSCSNSPANPFHLSKRNKHANVNPRRYRYRNIDDAATLTAVQKVLEMLNHDTAAASPLALPGFGKSPAVRQLRITDSPFPVKENEEEQVMIGKQADEFINKFYKDLNRQKSMAAIESPDHDGWGH